MKKFIAFMAILTLLLVVVNQVIKGVSGCRAEMES
jgi:hypothetical protein